MQQNNLDSEEAQAKGAKNVVHITTPMELQRLNAGRRKVMLTDISQVCRARSLCNTM
jgi:hypothetical protein